MRKKSIFVSLVSILLVISLLGCQTSSVENNLEKTSTYKEGTYIGLGNGKNGPIKVETTFSNDKITSVKVLEHGETVGIAESAIEKTTEDIVKEQSLAIDVVSGATYTSQGILDAVEQSVIEAGGDVSVLKLKKEKEDSNKEQAVEELEYDIVVVGAGAAGTAAALAASESNQKVLLLEKTAVPMGAGTIAGGMFAAESSLQKAANKVVDKEWLFDEYMNSSSGYMNSLLVRTIIEESSETVDWLIDNGCELSLVDAGTGGSYAHIGMPTTLHGYKEGGLVAINKLIDSFKGNGGDVLFSTPVKELLKNESGNVAGVIAEKEDGTQLKVKAKAVILATGGFGGNEEMLKEYFGEKYTIGEVASNMGDGLKMAWDAGAGKYGASTTHYFWQSFPSESMPNLIEALGNDFFALSAFTSYPHLRVNKLGQRFIDENTATNYAIHGAQIHMQPDQTEYIILDSSVLNKIATEGYVSIEDHYGKWKDDRQFYMEFNLPNDTEELIARENTPTDFRPLLEGANGTGVVFKGETLEELSSNMGIDSETFIKSVNQYNNAIDTKKDDLFFADTTNLTPVIEGPYYAVKYVTRNLGTLGGVRINEKIEAIDESGNPIPGLYVAGADAGGMYGQSYVDFEGGTLGFAYTSGKLAGRNAVEYIAK